MPKKRDEYEKTLSSFIEEMDNLGYRVNEKMDRAAFLKALNKTLSHIDNMDEAKEAIYQATLCIDNWEDMEKAYEENREIFLSYYRKRRHKSKYNLVDDKEAEGSMWATNALFGLEVINFAYPNEEMLTTCQSNKQVFASYGGEYFLWPDPDSEARMNLTDNKGNHLGAIALDEYDCVHFESGSFPYYLDDREFGYIAVYPKKYIATLKEGEEPDITKAVGEIEWDPIDEEVPDYGLARAAVYDKKTPLVPLIMLGLACFLIYGELEGEMSHFEYMDDEEDEEDYDEEEEDEANLFHEA